GAASRFAAAELFHRFGQPEAWEVYPEVREVLAALKASVLRLGVISNWDHRLPDLLDGLGLAPLLDAVVYSSQVGVEKPDRRIFKEAVRRLGVAPSATLHVGYGRVEDVEGAMAADLNAAHVMRHPGRRERSDLRDLSPLPRLVAGTASGTPVLH